MHLTVDVNFIDLFKGQQPLPISFKHPSAKATTGTMAVPSGHIEVLVKGSPHAVVDFRHVDHNHNVSYAMNESSNTGHALRTLNAVHQTVRRHMAQNPDLTHLHFYAANEDPSRIKAYHALARRIDPEYQLAKEDRAHHFLIKVPKTP